MSNEKESDRKVVEAEGISMADEFTKQHEIIREAYYFFFSLVYWNNGDSRSVNKFFDSFSK